MTASPRLLAALAFAFAATATGCASGPSMMSGGPGGGDDDGGGSGSNPQRPLDPTGTYAMTSTYDLATNMPGTAGTVVNTIIAATDDSDDPTRWIVDQILNQLPDGTVKSALELGKELVVGTLNQKLLDLAPDFVSTMVQVGNDFGDIAKHVELDETFALTGSGGNYTAVHTVVGLHYKLGNQEGDLLLANYQIANVVASNVAVTMDPTGQMTIAAHDIPLAYGQLLKLGLDGAIIPLIDSTAHNLNDLVAHKVDCTAVGNAIGDAIGFGAGTFTAGCTAGLGAGANFIYSKIAAIDGTALQFAINGTARAVDTNNDRQVDQIQTGTWAGTLSYGATPTPLLPAPFTGQRM